MCERLICHWYSPNMFTCYTCTTSMSTLNRFLLSMPLFQLQSSQKKFILYYTLYAMYNGNWTEWSAIWSEIIRVISKWNERTVQVWFTSTCMISDQNCMTRSSIATLLHPFINRTINSRNTYCKILFSTIMYWTSCQLNQFVKKWNQKCLNIAFWKHVSVMSMWCDWLFCFTVLFSLAEK